MRSLLFSAKELMLLFTADNVSVDTDSTSWALGLLVAPATLWI
jgi:hypothetical protein